MVLIKKHRFRNQKRIKLNPGKDSIVCQVIDWKDSDFYEQYEKDEDGKTIYDKEKNYRFYEIRGYAIADKKYSVCLHITGFQPYLYIKVPDRWNQRFVFKFQNTLEYKLNKQKNSIVSCRLVKRKELYGFHNDKKFNFLEIKCHNLGAFYEIRRILQGKKPFWARSDTDDPNEKTNDRFFNIAGTKYDFSNHLYETNISPLLRFFHDKEINPAGWVKIPARKYEVLIGEDIQTRCQLEVKCDIKDLISLTDKKEISPLVVASFDIECTSIDGSFPNPARRGDEVIQIGTTVHKYGEKHCCYKNIITLKKCDEIEGSKVVECKTESDLLLQWAKLIRWIDPDVITGYNIWGFDMIYMDTRCMNGCGGLRPNFVDMFYEIYSRNKKYPIKRKKDGGSGITEKTLASSALGQNFLKFWNAEGIIGIDMFKLIQKDYNLGSYKLDAVSQKFISGAVSELLVRDKTIEITSNNLDGLTVGQYVSLSISHKKVDREYLKTKFQIIDINEEDKKYVIDKVEANKFFKEDEPLDDFIKNKLKVSWYQNKVDLSPAELFKNYKIGTADKMKEIAVYCIKDCELVNFLMMKLDVITANIGAANVCCVPFSYLFLRGQGVKIFSCFAKECRNEGMMVKVLDKDKIDKSGYEGAIVFPPKPGVYFEPIAVMDYASLYPSSMIAENISHETLVVFREYDLDGNLQKEVGKPELLDLPDYNYNEIEYDIFHGVGDDKVKVGKKLCIFAEKKDGTKGLIPKILTKFLKARRDTRSSIKYKTLITKDGKEYIGLLKEKDDGYYINKVHEEPDVIPKDNVEKIEDTFNDFQKAVLDGLQLAYKVVCNSVYGQVGAPTSSICCKELAASTTATGRKMVILARDYTLEKYEGSKLTYGDSVLGDTPLLLKKDGKIEIKSIESLSKSWKKYEEFKPFDTNRKNKEQSDTDYMVWSKGKWNKIKRVIRHKTVKKIFRVNTHCGIVDVTEDHSLLNENYEKIKAEDCIINKTKLAHSFPTDFTEKLEVKTFNIELAKNIITNQLEQNKIIKVFDKIEAQIYYYLAKSLNYNIKLDINENGKYYLSKSNELKDKNIVKKIIKLNDNYTDYVYDLETEDGHFCAGIGEINVKNTDSVFISFKDYLINKYGEMDDMELLKKTIEVGQEAGSYVTSKLKHPQDLEYEKTFYPFVIFSKKRYFGNKYEFSTKKYKQTSMGIVLKRRDNAPIVKDIYGGVIDIILNKKNIKAAINYYKTRITNLLDGIVNIDDLVISKSIKATESYSNPTQIAHKVLADRIGERDPGNKPESNDRVPYCYIDKKSLLCHVCAKEVNSKSCKCLKCMKLFCSEHLHNHREKCVIICRFCKVKLVEKPDKEPNVTMCRTCHGWYCHKCMARHKIRKDKYKNIHHDKCKKKLTNKLLQGDIIEHPKYITDMNIKIDYRYYLDHQIQKPVMQIFELVMDNPGSITEEIIRKNDNKRNGLQLITRWFNIVKT